MAFDHLGLLRCHFYLGLAALVTITHVFCPDSGPPGSGQNKIPKGSP